MYERKDFLVMTVLVQSQVVLPNFTHTHVYLHTHAQIQMTNDNNNDDHNDTRENCNWFFLLDITPIWQIWNEYTRAWQYHAFFLHTNNNK